MSEDDDNEKLNLTAAADRIGVHKSTLTRWCQKGQGPPHYRLPSGTVLFPEDKLETWLDLYFHESNPPPESARGGQQQPAGEAA